MNLKLFNLVLLIIFGLVGISCITARPSQLGQAEGGTEDEGDWEVYEEAGKYEEDTHIVEIPLEGKDLPVSVFPEVWAYVLTDREEAWRAGLPITDIGYFGAEVNSFGRLGTIPDRRKIPSSFTGRVHLVAICHSRTLNHFVLRPGSEERKELIAGLLAGVRNYDGLQINFENVSARDAEPFLSFLKELREGLGNKMLSVAIPARTRKLAEDAYDYEQIKPLVDRILVMAYDEHWSTSAPGPIASLAWCRNVANYSMRVIGNEKLIMGIPFYGRGWSSPNHHQAYVFTGIERIIRENNVQDIRRENSIPTFEYTATISAKVYYEDVYSLSTRKQMYRSMGVRAIGFWRLGQETPDIWKFLQVGG